MTHQSVLSQESIEYLDIKPSGTYVDGTLGAAGHSLEIAKRLDAGGTLVAIDLDKRSIEHARGFLLGTAPTVHLVHDSAEYIPGILREHDFEKCDGILLDLGWNSDQFADPSRGFSFAVDGPLDMRLDTDDDARPTAAEIVNTWSTDDLVGILDRYADESWAKKIAAVIVEQRQETPIVSTSDLARLVSRVIPKSFHKPGIHPATKTFQALRIAVNDELGLLERSLPQLANMLAPGGRLVIITFHSGEDRIVKHLFRELAEADSFEILHKRGVVPSEEEIAQNPRARSARLRVLARTVVDE